MADKATEKGAGADPVASDKENLKLEHTDDKRDQAAVPPSGIGADVEPLEKEGRSSTTRDDHADLGVPMLPGSPDEPQGPEDALGAGPKRGDYTDRIGGQDYHPHAGGVPQRPFAEERGDVEGKKGGVETEAESKVA